jgi:putative DNA primase/helicase
MQLSRPRQIQLIVNFFAGVPADRQYHAADFDRDLAVAWQELSAWEQPATDDKAAILEIRAEVAQKVISTVRNGRQVWDEISAALDAQPTHYLSLLELSETLQPITWMWENWLPIGMLSMLAARPGTGKSLIALDLCRRVMTGEAWPDDSTQTRPGASCIYVDAENVPAILNKRAADWEQWGMDRRRIYPLIPKQDHDIVNLGDAEYQDLLWSMAYKLKPALIIVDSLRDILPNGESAVEDVRAVMAYLSNLAVQNAAAVLIVHHLRKGPQTGQLALMDSIDLDQVSGSGYIGGRSRVVMGLTKIQTGPKPNKNGPRKIEVVKTNLGEYPEDLGITFEQKPPDGLKLTWTTKAPERYQEPTERDGANEWLLGYLAEAGEPVNPKDVIAAAADAGYSRATVYRAREELKGEIVNSKGRRHPQNGWVLAGLDDSEDDVTG